jgi:hypothetical protein
MLGLAASGVLYNVWNTWLTSDILAAVLILAFLNISIRLSQSFWVWSVVGLGHVVYDIYTSYIVDTQTTALATQTAATPTTTAQDVIHYSPSLLVILGGILGWLDVAIPGTILMVAAVLAYRHQRPAVLYGGLAGYLVGFAGCGIVHIATGRGVATMLLLVPATMAGILLAAWRTGLLRYLSPRASTAGDTPPADTPTAAGNDTSVTTGTEPP